MAKNLPHVEEHVHFFFSSFEASPKAQLVSNVIKERVRAASVTSDPTRPLRTPSQRVQNKRPKS